MSKPHIPYFSFYPADFMNGVRGLSPQDVGVYTMLLCRIYEENGPVEYHELRLATYCGMRVPTFAKSVEKLLALGKVKIVGGMLSNERAEAEISKRAHDLKNNSKAGKASAAKRQQNQQNGATGVQQTFNHTDTDTDTDKKDGGGGSSGASKPEILPPETDREIILAAIGVDHVSGLTGRGGNWLGTEADMAEAGRWLALPGLTLPAVCAEITRIMGGKRDGPPSSFRYFTEAMQRLSGQLSQPALTPITNGQPRGQHANRQPDANDIGLAAQRIAARFQ